LSKKGYGQNIARSPLAFEQRSCPGLKTAGYGAKVLARRLGRRSRRAFPSALGGREKDFAAIFPAQTYLKV